MNDLGAPPQLRIKAAYVAAPYTHVKPTRNPPAEAVGGKGYQFVVDAALARKLRDEVRHRRMLASTEHTRSKEDDKEQKAESDLRIAKLVMSLPKPSSIGHFFPKAAEGERLWALSQKRGRLTPEEDAEEAHLIAWLKASHRESDGGYAVAAALERKASLTAEEQNFVKAMQARYGSNDFAYLTKTWDRVENRLLDVGPKGPWWPFFE